MNQPRIWSSVIRSLQLPLAEQNMDYHGLLRECGIEEEDLSRAHSKIPLERYLEFMYLAAAQAEDPLLGIRLAKTCGPETLGAVGFLFLSSRTLSEALTNFCSYLTLLQDTTDFQFIQNPSSIEFRYELFGVGDMDCRQDVEFSLTLTARLMRMFAGPEIEVLAFNFRHSPQAPVSEYERLLRARASFDQESNSISLPAKMARLPGRALDSSLLGVLKEFLDEQVLLQGREQSLRDQIRHALLGARIQAPVTGSKLARYLNTSQATLYRNLAAEGCTVGKVVGEVNFEIARNYLANSSLPITQIGYILGFAESASFTRAFKRWSGDITPSEYRNLAAMES